MSDHNRDFKKATASYEKWLAARLTIVAPDLRRKHMLMREAVFPFLRATFYRFAQLWPETVPDCADAPRVLAIGDLHVENFGTWRDVEGRLVWGINDFDEVCSMPYTIDLVRLATSAHFAIEADRLRIAHADACVAILSGYTEGLEAGGQPYVLAGRHAWLHQMVDPSLREPVAFWKKLTSLPPYEGRIPGQARRGISRLMPRKGSTYRIARRVAGIGSLGRERYVATAELDGGLVARESKALTESAWCWANPTESTGRIRYQKALDTSIRALDPFVHVEGGWIVRRLAPDCSKINLELFPKERDERRLLHAMGWETANVHLGQKKARKIIQKDLAARPTNWLHDAALKMRVATERDWKEWKRAR